MSGLDWFIARRYLASRKKGQFLSFITWIALGGVTVGVTALIVVISVMNGAQEELRSKILGSTPHVMVLQQGSALRMGDWSRVVEVVRSVDGVVGASPFILTQVAIQRGEYAQTADVYGVRPEPGEVPVTELEMGILEGEYDLGSTASGLPPLLVGSRLAERMQVFRGDTLVLISLENTPIDPFGNPRPVMRQFELTGTFTTGMYDYDIRNMYAPLEALQDLLGIGASNEISGVGVKVSDPWEAERVGREVRSALGPPYFVQSWITTNQSLFSALKLEKLAMAIILFLIVMVAAVNIVSTLVMVVVDRTREIGILKSMGMTDRQVTRIFMLQGLWIGIIGTVLGTGAGLVLAWVIDRYDIVSIPPDVYFLDRLPVAVDPVDVALIVLASVVVAFVATIYPASQASQLQPVEAIRHE